MITENGVSGPGEAGMSTEEIVKDGFRLKFYEEYLDNVCKAVREGECECAGLLFAA